MSEAHQKLHFCMQAAKHPVNAFKRSNITNNVFPLQSTMGFAQVLFSACGTLKKKYAIPLKNYLKRIKKALKLLIRLQAHFGLEQLCNDLVLNTAW